MMYGELSSYGIIHHKFEKEELKFLYEEVNFLKDNFSKATPANDELVGHIVNEYYLSGKTTRILQEMMMPLIQEYDARWPNFLGRPFFDRDVAIGLKDAWVNFQKKYEYNPVHDHSGIFSFVLWLNIPFDREEEDNTPYSRNVHPTARANGKFELLYTNCLGGIEGHRFPIDKSFEGVALLFPSTMKHCVYPFYTSDDYRISVSGNYHYRVPSS